MPGRSNRSRNARTSSVMMPRSSATSGRSPCAARSAVSSCCPRPCRHRPVLRRRRARGDLPVRLERTEVIDPHQIEPAQLRPQPVEPPAEAVSLHRVPVVQRIAPQLAVGVEVVGRHAGDGQRLAVRVERRTDRAATTPRRCCDRRRTADRQTAPRRARSHSASSAVHCNSNRYCSNSSVRNRSRWPPSSLRTAGRSRSRNSGGHSHQGAPPNRSLKSSNAP